MRQHNWNEQSLDLQTKLAQTNPNVSNSQEVFWIRVVSVQADIPDGSFLGCKHWKSVQGRLFAVTRPFLCNKCSDVKPLCVPDDVFEHFWSRSIKSRQKCAKLRFLGEPSRSDVRVSMCVSLTSWGRGPSLKAPFEPALCVCKSEKRLRVQRGRQEFDQVLYSKANAKYDVVSFLSFQVHNMLA